MVTSSDEAPDDLLDDGFLMGAARGMEAALEDHLRDQVGEGIQGVARGQRERGDPRGRDGRERERCAPDHEPPSIKMEREGDLEGG